MSNSNEYRPLRVLKDHTVSGTDMVKLRKIFPNGKPASQGDAERCYLKYHAAQVVNIPTVSEVDMLDRDYGKGRVAVAIPQDPEGFDDPTTNLARSRKGSAQGRREYELAKAREEREMKAVKPEMKGGETN